MKRALLFAALVSLLPNTFRGDTAPNPPPCSRFTDPSKLYYPAVDASYVGGTALHMGMKAGWPPHMFDRQFRVGGQVAIAPDGFLFIFKNAANGENSNKEQHKKKLQLIPKFADGKVGPCTSGKTSNWIIAIRYGEMKDLLRANSIPSDLSSISTLYATLAASGLSTLVTTVPLATDTKVAIGSGAALGLGLAYYGLIYRPRSRDNYIDIFVGRDCTEKSSTESSKCDLFIVKIPNKHDYYNISMILTTKTGIKLKPQTSFASTSTSASSSK